MYKNKISAVYKIVNTVTNDCYVGSSKNVYSRWKEHKCPSSWKKRPNSPLYLDMQKYGLEKFGFQILVTVEPEYLKDVEQEFIELLRPTYNNYRANGLDVERYKETDRKYHNQLCFYNGETLTLNALSSRFRKARVENPTKEAKKYLLPQQ